MPHAILPLLTRIADTLSIILAGWLALQVRLLLDLPFALPVDLTGYWAIIIAGGLFNALLSGSVHRSWRGADLPQMLGKVIGRWLLVQALLLLGLFVFKTSQDISRFWFLVWGLCAVFALATSRLLIYLGLRALRKRGLNQKRVVVVGAGQVADELRNRVARAGWSGYALDRVIENPTAEDLAHLGLLEVDEVWLALPVGGDEILRDTLHALRHSTAAIRFVPDLFMLRLINHGVSEILGLTMYDLSTSPMTGMNQLVKWLEDKVLSSLILLLISPLMIFLALGVKLTSPGPVFYRQERVGLNNKPFRMLKFRSMPVDTEKSGVQWGGSAAKATTRFGQFIRKTSLDELPQFLNVLKGDMSIVGPRPERPMFVEQFKEEIPDYMKKHMVKAGITGWAQVHGWRGDTDLHTRIEYDLYYIENWSLWLDLKIIVMTVLKGFVNKNAY